MCLRVLLFVLPSFTKIWRKTLYPKHLVMLNAFLFQQYKEIGFVYNIIYVI